MRPLPWITGFAAIVFTIGWTSKLVADRMADVPPTTSPSAEKQGHGECNRCKRKSGGGPYLATLQEFSDQLSMTDEQLRQLDELVQETKGKVRDLEREKWAVYSGTRGAMFELLTDEQGCLFGELVGAKMNVYVDEKIEHMMCWLDQRFAADSAERLKIEGIVRDFEYHQGELYRSLYIDAEDTMTKDLKEALHELVNDRDGKLGQFLNEKDLADYRSASRLYSRCP